MYYKLESMMYIFKNEKLKVYKDGFMYYYSIGNDVVNFIPYTVYRSMKKNEDEVIVDINDFANACSAYCNEDELNDILDNIHKSHLEDVDNIWNKIEFIKKLKVNKNGKNKANDKNKDKNKNKRKLKILLNYCRDVKELTVNEDIKMINTYSTDFDKRTYIIDIISTLRNNFYVRIIDITDNYETIELSKFKAKYAQPTLFDDIII